MDAGLIMLAAHQPAVQNGGRPMSMAQEGLMVIVELSALHAWAPT
jgi:hypothetical protein